MTSRIKGFNNRAGSTDRPFFNRAQGRTFDVHAEGDAIELELYDEIGFWGVTAKDFRAALRDAKGHDVRLKINSPGGDVFDGIAMHNDLLDHTGNVQVEITGLAASAASIVAMAGDEVAIAANAFVMIHNAWAVAIGDRNDMDATAAILGQIDDALAGTYAERTGLDRADVADMMDAETWLGADAAVDQGFADATTGDADASARFDLSCFNNVPDALRREFGGARTKRDYERALRDAGASRSEARAMLAAGYDADTRLRDAGGDHADTMAALRRLTQTISTE